MDDRYAWQETALSRVLSAPRGSFIVIRLPRMSGATSFARRVLREQHGFQYMCTSPSTTFESQRDIIATARANPERGLVIDNPQFIKDNRINNKIEGLMGVVTVVEITTEDDILDFSIDVY